jgi:hypothetical protein
MTADKELAAALDALGFGEADAERRAAQTEAAQLPLGAVWPGHPRRANELPTA